jgi:hypothetical protein
MARRGHCRISSRPVLRSRKDAGSGTVHMQPPGRCTAQFRLSLGGVPRNSNRTNGYRTLGLVARRSQDVDRATSLSDSPSVCLPRRRPRSLRRTHRYQRIWGAVWVARSKTIARALAALCRAPSLEVRTWAGSSMRLQGPNASSSPAVATRRPRACRRATPQVRR